jgi:hypothetical protein
VTTYAKDLRPIANFPVGYFAFTRNHTPMEYVPLPGAPAPMYILIPNLNGYMWNETQARIGWGMFERTRCDP